MRLVKILAVVIIAILVIGAGIYIYHIQTQKTKLIILHAGSLTVHMEEFEKIFEERHPNVDVVLKAYGSRQAAMRVAELEEKCDVLAVADYKVIEEILIPKNLANWYIAFASDEICLAFTNSSKRANKINETNWYVILQRPDVKWGHSDPNLDPCGYRALLVIKLAEIYYNVSGLFDKLNGSANEVIRPKSVELISMLESGELDYAFEYLFVAKQHNLRYVRLPPEINLGNWSHADFYAKANITLSDGTIKVGEPILYGITIPKTCEHWDLAIEFVRLVLGAEGREVLVAKYLQPLDTYLTNNITKVPSEIKNDPQIGQRLEEWSA
ncbi:MAG: extracellular solute-binding protein [Candidatus Baldrarchaeia archaeon]